MKKKQIFALTLVLMLLLATLTGCGGSSTSTTANKHMMAADYAVEEAAAAEPREEAGGALNLNSSVQGASAVPENRKWIVTVHISAETDDLDAMTAALDQKIAAMNGYVENQSVYNGSTYANRRYRNANLTVRIPAETVDRFTEEVGGIANVVSKSKNLEDITLKYVSTESRMTALQTEEARLLEFMEKAETMSDLLEIEARLTEVRAELESVTSQMRLYNNQIDYATIYLNIEEVQEYTPVEDPTFLERIREGFSDSLKGLSEGAVDITVWIIANSPYLAVFAVLFLLIISLRKRAPKLRFRKKAKKNEEQK